MKVLTVVILFLIAITLTTPAFALQQSGAKLVYNLSLGETETFQWTLISGSKENIIVKLASSGQGHEMLSFPSEVTLYPRQAGIVDITVNVPDDYTDNIILTPRVTATQFGVSDSGTTVINIAMATTLSINIGDNPIAPEKEVKVIPEIIREAEIVTIEPQEKSSFVIKKDKVEMIPEPTPEPQPDCGAGTKVVDGYCKVISSGDNSMTLNEKSIMIIVVAAIVGTVVIVSINYKMKKK